MRHFLLALLGGALAGCGTSGAPLGRGPALAAQPIDAALLARQQQHAPARPRLDALRTPATPYVIGAGDVLTIVVWDHPELASTQLAPPPQGATADAASAPPPGFLVGDDGTIQFPYAGPLTVAGLTEAAARDQLAARLGRVLNHPSVTLRVQAFRSQRIYVGGEVRQPGLLPINDIPMTLVEALNRAGGILPTGDQSHISVVRAGQRYRVDLPALIAEGADPARLILRHGDLVQVGAAEDNKVFVAGEVITPRALPMHNGRLTLNEALGEAGGINPVSADQRQVFVVRRAGQQPELYVLDAAAPGALAIAEGFELQARDVVYVAPSGLANWHRTLSQLIPGTLPAAVSASKQ